MTQTQKPVAWALCFVQRRVIGFRSQTDHPLVSSSSQSFCFYFIVTTFVIRYLFGLFVAGGGGGDGAGGENWPQLWDDNDHNMSVHWPSVWHITQVSASPQRVVHQLLVLHSFLQHSNK